MMSAKNKNRRERNLAELRRKYGAIDSSLKEKEEYSVDLLATVASHLLVGNDYTEAITRAVGLLDACRWYVGVEWIESIQPKLLDKRRHVPFTEAVKDITGYSDNEHARETFYDFFAEIISLLHGKGVEKQEFEALVQRHIDEGFAPETIILLNSLFFRYWRMIQRRLPKKRANRPKKKA
jgi:hypothetical protein